MVCVLDGKVEINLYVGRRLDGTGAPRASIFVLFYQAKKKNDGGSRFIAQRALIVKY